MDLDQAVFAYDDEHSVAEVYLSFEAAGLPFEQRAGSFLAELPLEIAVVRQSDAELQDSPLSPVWEDNSAIAFAVQDTSILERGQFFVHQFRALLPPGEYELRVKVPADAESGRREMELRRDLEVRDYSTSRPVLSDATLASEIRPSTDRGSPFYKNGFLVRPNPNRLYGESLNALFYYVEAYNLDQIGDAAGSYQWYAFISEANRVQPFADLEQRSLRPVRSPDVIVGSFNLSAVPSGSYFLHLVVLDEANEAVSATARKFFVYNPDVEAAPTVFLEETFETSEYASMPEEQVEQALAHARLISNDQELRRIRALDEIEDRRRFLMDFWKARDPDPSTPQNEYRQEFLRRIEFANDRYSTSYVDGWETDRGRILIRYGQPIAIEPHLYDRDMLPHEIWQYNNIPGEGQAVFVFADRNSFGEFELIHSSVAGERSLPDWSSELRRR